MPEYAELLILVMALLALIKCGTSAVKSIHENARWKKGQHPDQQGNKIVPTDNTKAGTESNPAAFLK
jgi:hypothetical protein